MIFERQVDVKPQRACELCLQKQAVLYCASDDAFLCQSCDVSVHSANQVAIKHERVCLKTNETPNNVPTSRPVWHSGFRRKARTRRIRCGKKPQYNLHERREDPRVPEIGGTGMFYISEKNNDDDLTSLVPEFQGFFMTQDAIDDSLKLHTHFSGDINSSLEFQEELERKTLRADTEEVMKQLNFEDEIEAMEDVYSNEDAKINGNKSCPEQSLITCRKGHDKFGAITDENGESEANVRQRNMLLRLNYEDVIAAWDKQGSPSNFQLVPPGMDFGGGAEEKRLSNRSEREARVWRYRDKRKTRLFQKKIRYEVRKVNADKRPRMKGRFVRRTLPNDCF